MCTAIRPIKVYKVLRCDFLSPIKECPWPKSGGFSSGRGELTKKERMCRYVEKGLHFYRSLEVCKTFPGEIVVECTTETPLVVTDMEVVAIDCVVGNVVLGGDLVALATLMKSMGHSIKHRKVSANGEWYGWDSYLAEFWPNLDKSKLIRYRECRCE